MRDRDMNWIVSESAYYLTASLWDKASTGSGELVQSPRVFFFSPFFVQEYSEGSHKWREKIEEQWTGDDSMALRSQDHLNQPTWLNTENT